MPKKKDEKFFWFNEEDFTLFGDFSTLKEAQDNALCSHYGSARFVVVQVVSIADFPERSARTWKPA